MGRLRAHSIETLGTTDWYIPVNKYLYEVVELAEKTEKIGSRIMEE